MASTYSTNLAIELIGTGDQAGSWGNTTNTNLGTLIEQAISGYVTQAVSTGTDTTITIPNGATGVARNMYIELTGTGGASTNLIVPANKKLYFIFNNTSSGQVTVKVSGQTGVSVPNKAKMVLVSNGTDIVDATNYVGNLSAASANITVLTSASATITNLINTSASITTITNSPTFSAGTANGVTYLNGSKELTSGSALQFSGTNLSLGAAVTSATWGQFVGVQATYPGFVFSSTASGGKKWSIGADAAVLTFRNETDSTTAAVIDGSNNLGIGTSSPAYKLDVAESGAPTSTNTFSVARISGSDSVANDLTLLGPNTSQVRIKFGDPESATIGEVGYNHSTNSLRFVTNGAEAGVFDSSGNLGLGVTPSAWSGMKAFQLGDGTFAMSSDGAGAGDGSLTWNGYYNGTNWIYGYTGGGANRFRLNESGAAWFTAPSGTAGNTITFTQAMTLDANGTLTVKGTGSGNGNLIFDDPGTAIVSAQGTAGSELILNGRSLIKFTTGGTPTGTERARITSGGAFLVGTTSSSNRIIYVKAVGNGGDYFGSFENDVSSNPLGIDIRYSAAAPNNAGNQFLDCRDSGTTRAQIRSNGGLANFQANDANLSDERVKTDIKPVGSYWDKFKAIEIVAFKYKDQTHDDDNIGVIAQQVESVAPEFIDVDGFGETPEDGVPLKTVYTTDMYHAAIKALQEAMARIESLEAKVAALEAK